MADPEVLLEVANLRYSYGDRVAVNDVSFDIHVGEIFGFLGPNGAGKTTTISCVAGLLSNYTGQLRFRGQPFVPHLDRSHRAKLGVVPQELALYEDLTGRENLSFFGRLQGIDRRDLPNAVERGLDIAGLTDRSDDRVKEFSGGMKRRLNLAIGDLHNPDLLLLDEPTAGVDPQSRNHLFEALGRLKDSGRTILYTTHYMEEAQRLCGRVAIINEGELTISGTPRELAIRIDEPDANLETVFLHHTGRSLRD